MVEDYAIGYCAICTFELEPNELTRSVSTPKGRRPVHAECHQKYMDIEAGQVVPVRDPNATFVNHIATEEAEMAEGKAVTQWDEKWAADAERWAQSERVGGDFLSVKGGVLTFQDEPLPGNQMLVVILDAVIERTFYAEKYDPNMERSNPPICYAFGRADDEEELAPHPTMQADLSYFEPQNDICKTCPNNAWGSADTGRGKACGERRRMALLPAGYFAARRGSRDFDMHVITDPQHYESADIAYLKLPVTSVKEWAKYVTTLASAHRRPPAAAITRMYIEGHQDHQFHVKFEMIELLPVELAETIMARVAEAEKNIIFGYSPPGTEAEEAPAPARSVRRR